MTSTAVRSSTPLTTPNCIEPSIPTSTSSLANAEGGISKESPKKKKVSAKGFWVRTSPCMLEKAEDRILHSILGHIYRHDVGGINTISSIPPPSSTTTASPIDARKHIILIHGFAGGLANFVPNWEALVKEGGDKAVIHAIDLPGFARSSRHDSATNKAPKFTTPESVMDYYSERILQWLHSMHLIDRTITPLEPKAPIVIAGHSFGGYLSACFATRHPNLLQHLVLIDPWGVNPRNLEREKAFGWKASVLLFALRSIDGPLAILRWAGPCGTALLPRFRPDFYHRWQALIGDGSAFNDYTYHCNVVTPPTGERAFQACCGGMGADVPLIDLFPRNFDKLQKLKISFIYGEETWMDVKMGMKLVGKTMQYRRDHHTTIVHNDYTSSKTAATNWVPAPRSLLDTLEDTTSSSTNDNVNNDEKREDTTHLLENGTTGYGVSIDYIAGAGHQVMADNAVGFNEALLNRIFRWSPVSL